jgi:hypothetical protein
MIDGIWQEYDEDGSGDLDKEETRKFVDQIICGLKGNNNPITD